MPPFLSTDAWIQHHCISFWLGQQNPRPNLAPPIIALQNLDRQFVSPQYVGSQNRRPENFGLPGLSPQYGNQHPELDDPILAAGPDILDLPIARQINPQYGNPFRRVPKHYSFDRQQIPDQAVQAPPSRNILRSYQGPTVQMGHNAVVSQANVNPSAPYMPYDDHEANFINRVADDPQSLPYVLDEIFHNSNVLSELHI